MKYDINLAIKLRSMTWRQAGFYQSVDKMISFKDSLHLASDPAFEWDWNIDGFLEPARKSMEQIKLISKNGWRVSKRKFKKIYSETRKEMKQQECFDLEFNEMMQY